jgi:hypothetical protein
VAADPTRRRVLTAAALAALTAAGAAGCAPGRPWPWATPPQQAPDATVLQGAIAAEAALISRYHGVLAAVPGLAGTAAPMLSQHQAHLDELRQWLLIPAGARPSPAATTRARRAPVPAGRTAAIAYLRAAEHDQADLFVGSLATAMTPSLAQLLASTGACEATHAALLRSRRAAGVTVPVPGGGRASAAAITALQAALAAENAAIFGYGVAGAYLAGARQATATAYWNDHRAARDALAGLLRGYGKQPVAAADAYRLPFGVRTAAEAVSLAAFLEDGVTTAYLGVVAAGDAGLRAFGARAMQNPAIRATYWRGPGVAFPGIPAAALKPPQARHQR